MTQALVDMLVNAGATASEARTIVDLSKHAAEQAIETISRVANTGETTLIRQTTFLATLRFLEVNIGETMGSIKPPPPPFDG